MFDYSSENLEKYKKDAIKYPSQLDFDIDSLEKIFIMETSIVTLEDVEVDNILVFYLGIINGTNTANFLFEMIDISNLNSSDDIFLSIRVTHREFLTDNYNFRLYNVDNDLVKKQTNVKKSGLLFYLKYYMEFYNILSKDDITISSSHFGIISAILENKMKLDRNYFINSGFVIHV